jgi:hypothetical protein
MFRIASNLSFPSSKGESWGLFEYYYIPIDSTSAISSGETKTLAMAYDSQWVASSNDSWINVEDTVISNTISLDNIDAINVTVVPNTSKKLREGTITIVTENGTDTIHVYQDGIDPKIEPSKDIILSSASETNGSVSIKSNVNWVALSDSEWIELGYAIGTGDDILPVKIVENTTGKTRTAEIIINGDSVTKTIYVTQTGEESVPTTISFLASS